MKPDLEAIRERVKTCVGFVNDCPEGPHSDTQELMGELVALVEQQQAEIEKLKYSLEAVRSALESNAQY